MRHGNTMAAPVSTKVAAMQTNVTSWAMVAVGAALIGGSGEALAPDAALDSCSGGERSTPVEAAQPLDPGQRVLVEYLSRRFYIAAAATERMVGAAYSAAREVGLDPLLG